MTVVGVLWRAITAVVVVAVLLVIAAIVSSRIEIPDHLNPWAPLGLDEPVNVLTRYKLERASADHQMCRAALRQTRWTYAQVQDEVTKPGCGYENAIRIRRMELELNEPFTLSCRAALSLALWERNVLQPAALRYFGAPVTRLEHFGSYSCRSVYGRPNARMSHHATADALDVAGFVFGKQRRIRVLGDWPKAGPEGLFLREVHDGACSFFDSVIGPDYNAAHRDHFHFDRGSFRFCR